MGDICSTNTGGTMPRDYAKLKVFHVVDDLALEGNTLTGIELLGSALNITNTTFGGLEATAPPRLGLKPTVKRPTTSKILDLQVHQLLGAKQHHEGPGHVWLPVQEVFGKIIGRLNKRKFEIEPRIDLG